MRFALLTAAALATTGLTAGHHTDRDGGIFDSRSVVTLTVQAPLSQLFDRGRRDEKFSVPARVAVGEATAVAATLELRGNTSKDECSFPKLQLHFDKGADSGPFSGLHGVKIGTHCGESRSGTLTKKYGRLANEQSPWREVVVYRMLEAVGARTPRVRAARITYVDSSRAAGAAPLTRNALLLEDEDAMKQRVEATGEISPEEFTSAQDVFSPEDSARIAFAEALIGNFDWCLLFSPADEYRCDARKKLWNLSAFRTDSGAVPVMADFDLAGPVTGRHIWFDHVFNKQFAPTSIEAEVIAQVQRTRTLFPRARLDATRREFMARRAAVEQAIATADVDARGAELARAYTEAFYRAIETDDAFYRPVVVLDGARIFTGPANDVDACGRGDSAPPGTPVNVLRTEGKRAQVQILDALWRWAPPMECVPVHSGPVWIDAEAVGRDFPRRVAGAGPAHRPQ